MSEIMKIRAQGYLIGILALILGIWSISQSLEFRELKEKNAELNQKAEKLAVQLEARQMEIDVLEELRLEELRIMSAIENSKVDTLAVRNNNPLNIKAIKRRGKGRSARTGTVMPCSTIPPTAYVPRPMSLSITTCVTASTLSTALLAGSVPGTGSSTWPIFHGGSVYAPTRASISSTGFRNCSKLWPGSNPERSGTDRCSSHTR